MSNAAADAAAFSYSGPSSGLSASPETASNQVYYNPRLDPRNFLEGPLSDNPATRLRQMLARPGIVVRKLFIGSLTCLMHTYYLDRLLQVSVMVSVQDVL